VLDTEGDLYPDVMDIRLDIPLGWKRVIKIGDKETWVEDLGKDPEAFEELVDIPGEGAFIPEETYLGIKERIQVA
jgi:hypothetical protein